MKRQLGTAQERLEELERMLKVELIIAFEMMGTRSSGKFKKTQSYVFQINLNKTETISFLLL